MNYDKTDIHKRIDCSAIVYNYSNRLNKSEKLETENILIDDTKCKDLVIYFTSYANNK